MKYLKIATFLGLITLFIIYVFIPCFMPNNNSSFTNLSLTHANVTTNSYIPILHLSGTPYEIGFQHGSWMKSSIVLLVSRWKKDIETKYHTPADTFIKTFLDATQYQEAIKKWTPDLLEEIKGISDGSGIDFNTIFAFQLNDEMAVYADTHDLHHCTSLGVNNFLKDKSPNLIAQNIDVDSLYHGYEIILEINTTETATSRIITTYTGYLGANGINRYLGITENSLTDLISSTDGLPVCCVMRSTLEQKSFEDAVQFIKNVNHASGQNYLLGSQNKIISLECSADKITEYWPSKSRYYTYHANQALSNNSWQPSYLQYIQDTFHTNPESITFGDPRLDIMQVLFQNKAKVDIPKIKSVLTMPPVYNKKTWLSTVMEFSGNYSKLLVSTGKGTEPIYSEFEIKE